MIAIAPSSWSGPSAAIVRRMDRSPDELDVARHLPRAAVVEHVIGRCSAAVWTPNGSVGVVDEQMIVGSRTRPIRSGTCPPPVPSTW